MTEQTIGAMPGTGAAGRSLASPGFMARYVKGRDVGVLALLLILGFLTLYPFGMLLYGSLHSTPPGMKGEFNLHGYAEVLKGPAMGILWNTVGISLAKTIPALTMAVFLAWIIARTDTPYRAQLEVLITLPFFIPPILTAMAWAMLGNPQVGLLNTLFKWVTGANYSPINVYSWGEIGRAHV